MRILLLCISILLIISCKEKNKGNLIYGKLTNAKNEWVHLQRITDNGELSIDSVQTGSDGSFEMKNPITALDFYVFRTDKSNLIFLLLDGRENVEINGDAKNLEATYKVHGSKDSELIQELRSFDRSLTDSLNRTYDSLRAILPEKKDSIGLELQQVYTEEMGNFSRQFIRENMGSLVALSATKFIDEQNELALMKELQDSLQARYPDNKYVIDYAQLVADLGRLPLGSPAPDIELKTPDGKNLSLSSLRGKVVLIDFWASWCLPCRRENPQLVEMYNSLKGSPFEIFGVSLDSDLAAWKNAIQKDKLTWPQVSELKKWESGVVREYHIESIPFSVLVDKEGFIISKGLRGDDLEFKIREALAANS